MLDNLRYGIGAAATSVSGSTMLDAQRSGFVTDGDEPEAARKALGNRILES